MTERQRADGGRSWLERPWRTAAITAAGALVVASIAQTAVAGVVAARIALVFAALIAFGELLRLTLPGDRESAPIGSAGALAYALLAAVGGHLATQSALQVIAVVAVGMVVGALPHLAAGRPVGLDGMAARLIAVSGIAFVFRPVAAVLAGQGGLLTRVLVMVGLLAAGWLVECLIRARTRAQGWRGRARVALGDEMRVQLPLGVAVAASAMLMAFAAEEMGLAALAIFIAPLLVTHVAFRRYAGIRATYLQTVRALARVTEVGGYVEDGHAHRVGQLAVAVGRELGMSEPDLLELEYAALMHDIGQLSLRGPIPGGATVHASRDDQRRIAELGAGVIEQARVLDRVADIVRHQSCPWHADGGMPPLGSRIIRVANAFDDMVGGSAEIGRVVGSLDVLRTDGAAGYDPEVVEALAKVVARRHARRR